MGHLYLMDVLNYKDAVFHTGADSTLFAQDGSEYIDFFTDVGTASLGYCSGAHLAVYAKLIHHRIPTHAPNLYGFSWRNAVAKRICEMTGMDKVFFCNSGTESVEAAIKLARKYHYDNEIYNPRTQIWSYEGGFHGRTGFSLAAGDGPSYHYNGFGPLPQNFYHFNAIEQIPEDAAAVILAPIFGNNDVRMYDEKWLWLLREFTDRYGILLIFDEVQSGSGRCGAMTYAQKIGIQPDILTLAKGIAMGCPVGVMLAKQGVAKAFTPGVHFSTFGGNPLACAFTMEMLDWLSHDSNLEGVEFRGKAIKDTLQNFKWPKKIRGTGMLIAFDIDIDGLKYAQACFEEGLLIGAFRPGPGPVKITPPLNISMDDLYLGLERLDKAYRKASE